MDLLRVRNRPGEWAERTIPNVAVAPKVAMPWPSQTFAGMKLSQSENRRWLGNTRGLRVCGMCGRHVSQTLELPRNLGLRIATSGRSCGPTSPTTVISAPAQARNPFPSLGTSSSRRSDSPARPPACRRGGRAWPSRDDSVRRAGACRAAGRVQAPSGSRLRRFRHRIFRDGSRCRPAGAAHGPQSPAGAERIQRKRPRRLASSRRPSNRQARLTAW
jgi:hypothetical protein